MNRLRADADFESSLLGAPGGGIGQISSKSQILKSFGIVVLQCREIFGKAYGGFEVAVGGEFALDRRGFFDLPFLRSVVPAPTFLPDDPDFSVLHGFAEEVVGVEVENCVATRKIISAVGIDADGEGGEFITANTDFGVAIRPVIALFRVEFCANGAIAELYPLGNIPFG